MTDFYTDYERNHASISTPISDKMAKVPSAGGAQISGLSELGEAPWEAKVGNQIIGLQSLPHNWDGYGAGPIRQHVIWFMLHLLARIMRSETPAPDLTPMSHEGLLVEWHYGGIDLEIEIETPGHLWVSYTVDGVPDEWPLQNDFHSLEQPINQITLAG